MNFSEKAVHQDQSPTVWQPIRDDSRKSPLMGRERIKWMRLEREV